jgi:hypothetical protein
MGTKEKLVIVLITILAIMAVPDLLQQFTKRISWDKYSTEGRRLILFGDKDKAVDFYKGEVRKTIVEKGVKDPAYIAALEGLALAYQKQEMYLSAEDQYNEALNQLGKSWLPDRVRMKETMGLMAAMYTKIGDTAKLDQVHVRERGLNTWWQWFWCCFVVTFAAEALYMAVVLARPGDIDHSHFKVEHGWLYAFACLVGTVGMMRGLLMSEMDVIAAFFSSATITLALLPFVFGTVLVFARQLGTEDARKLIETPSAKRAQKA